MTETPEIYAGIIQTEAEANVTEYKKPAVGEVLHCCCSLVKGGGKEGRSGKLFCSVSTKRPQEPDIKEESLQHSLQKGFVLPRSSREVVGGSVRSA